MLGEKLYFRISRKLFPREVLSSYGNRSIMFESVSANAMLKHLMANCIPCSVGKLGATELSLCCEFLEMKKGTRKRFSDSIVHEIFINSGVYPQSESALIKFAECYIRYCGSLSHLAVWYRPGEKEFVTGYMERAKLFRLQGLDPIPFRSDSWLQGLANKRVLVISPFTRSVQKQYENREKIWSNCPGFLPSFTLLCLKAPLSAGLVTPELPDWETSLNALISQMNSLEFDIVLVGAGAFSIPLTVEAEKRGAASVHLGGQLQIIFGIMGGRWIENETLRQVVNEFWVRPSGDEVPKNYKQNEGGCYW